MTWKLRPGSIFLTGPLSERLAEGDAVLAAVEEVLRERHERGERGERLYGQDREQALAVSTLRDHERSLAACQDRLIDLMKRVEACGGWVHPLLVEYDQIKAERDTHNNEISRIRGKWGWENPPQEV